MDDAAMAVGQPRAGRHRGGAIGEEAAICTLSGYTVLPRFAATESA